MSKERHDEQTYQHLGEASELWQEWLKHNSVATRNAIFEYYFPWCRNIASKLFLDFQHHMMEWHDFMHTSSLSLLASIEKFTPARGVPFEAYAYPAIKGSVVDELKIFTKDHDKATKNMEFEEYKKDRIYLPEDNSDPLSAIVDSAIGLAFGMFLEDGIFDNTINAAGPQVHYEKNIIHKTIISLLNHLNRQQVFVLKSHYFQHLSFIEIATILELSKARISQIHRSGIMSLKSLYEKLDNGEQL